MARTADPKCVDFAEDWLSDGYTRPYSHARAHQLALGIQQLVQDYCQEWDEQDAEQRMLRGYTDAERVRI